MKLTLTIFNTVKYSSQRYSGCTATSTKSEMRRLLWNKTRRAPSSLTNSLAIHRIKLQPTVLKHTPYHSTPYSVYSRSLTKLNNYSHVAKSVIPNVPNFTLHALNYFMSRLSSLLHVNRSLVSHLYTVLRWEKIYVPTLSNRRSRTGILTRLSKLVPYLHSTIRLL